MAGHEVDGLRGDVLGSHNQIAFVLAIFVIHQDDEFALFDVSNGVFDAMKRCGHRSHIDLIVSDSFSMEGQFII